MPFHQDYIMRQIEMLAQFVARTIFKKDYIEYEIEDEYNLSNTDMLHNELKDLVDKLKLCEAENLLFERMREDDLGFLLLALDFYGELNKLSDKQLEAGDFTREEIYEGLEDVLKRFGVSLPWSV